MLLGRDLSGYLLFRLVLCASLFSTIAACDSTSVSLSKLPEVNATFIRADGSESETFSLEVASTDATRSKGLMFRKEMPERSGMIFVFPSERINSFWMKNTILSLDMLFVSSDFRIVGILPRVPPQNEDPRQVDQQSQYVIELGAGIAEKYKIASGSSVRIAGQLPTVSH